MTPSGVRTVALQESRSAAEAAMAQKDKCTLLYVLLAVARLKSRSCPAKTDRCIAARASIPLVLETDDKAIHSEV